MLANTISLDDQAPSTFTFDLVSREGMESVRRETTAGVTSAEGSVLKISNTVDLSAPNNKNRHLVQLQWNDIDGTTGDLYPGSVHVVIARHKKVSDAVIQSKLEQLCDFLLDTSNVADLLRGGN